MTRGEVTPSGQDVVRESKVRVVALATLVDWVMSWLLLTTMIFL